MAQLADGTIINEAARVGSRPATRVRVRELVWHGRHVQPRPSRYGGQYGIVVRVVADVDTLFVRLAGGAVVPFGHSEVEVLG